MKIGKSFEKSDALVKLVSETIENEEKGGKNDFSACY